MVTMSEIEQALSEASASLFDETVEATRVGVAGRQVCRDDNVVERRRAAAATVDGTKRQIISLFVDRLDLQQMTETKVAAFCGRNSTVGFATREGVDEPLTDCLDG